MAAAVQDTSRQANASRRRARASAHPPRRRRRSVRFTPTAAITIVMSMSETRRSRESKSACNAIQASSQNSPASVLPHLHAFGGIWRKSCTASARCTSTGDETTCTSETCKSLRMTSSSMKRAIACCVQRRPGKLSMLRRGICWWISVNTLRRSLRQRLHQRTKNAQNGRSCSSATRAFGVSWNLSTAQVHEIVNSCLQTQYSNLEIHSCPTLRLCPATAPQPWRVTSTLHAPRAPRRWSYRSLASTSRFARRRGRWTFESVSILSF